MISMSFIPMTFLGMSRMMLRLMMMIMMLSCRNQIIFSRNFKFLYRLDGGDTVFFGWRLFKSNTDDGNCRYKHPRLHDVCFDSGRVSWNLEVKKSFRKQTTFIPETWMIIAQIDEPVKQVTVTFNHCFSRRRSQPLITLAVYFLFPFFWLFQRWKSSVGFTDDLLPHLQLILYTNPEVIVWR